MITRSCDALQQQTRVALHYANWCIEVAVMSSSNVGKKIGFIGAGNMAQALAQGFISKKKVDAKDIWCTDVIDEPKKAFKKLGANAVDSNAEVHFEILLARVQTGMSLSRARCGWRA